jgi:hypothetical protein
MTHYPYTQISENLAIPPAPILPVMFTHPDASRQREYQVEGFLDTGSDCTLIPLEAVSGAKKDGGRRVENGKGKLRTEG